MSYPDELMEHYRHPQHRGVQADVREGHAINQLCGDEIRMFVGQQVTFEGVGCAISLGVADLLCGWVVQGETVEAEPDWIMQRIGMQLAPGRTRCGTLAAEAYLQAVSQGKD